MRRSNLNNNNNYYFTTIILLLLVTTISQSHAAPSGPLIKHLSSLLKWTTSRSSSKTPFQDGNVLQFEDGYLVETVVEGNAIGVVPHKIRISHDGELFAVDEVNSNVVKITPPLSQYSRARLVAGSFQGYAGHVDGKSNEARFNHPKGLAMDDKGNIYVADTLNLAIRKIADSGVTTIAGGKSNVVGYRDGPSEDAKFSNDFDLVYIHSTCSLLVIDRGNAALRQISLNNEDCDVESSSITASDILMVVGAVVAGYAACMLQQGIGSSFFSRMQESSETEFKGQQPSKEKPTPIINGMKEEPKWPSFGQLVVDLCKLALESLGSVFLSFTPPWIRQIGSKRGLTPLKDHLRMPEDEATPAIPPVKKQSIPALQSESRQIHIPSTSDKYSELVKPPKIKSASMKDPSLSGKHRSSKRQEYPELYGSGDVSSYSRSKTHKEKTRHRQREKSGEVAYGSVSAEPKPVEPKPVDYDNAKYDPYNITNKYGSASSYRF